MCSFISVLILPSPHPLCFNIIVFNIKSFFVRNSELYKKVYSEKYCQHLFHTVPIHTRNVITCKMLISDISFLYIDHFAKKWKLLFCYFYVKNNITKLYSAILCFCSLNMPWKSVCVGLYRVVSFFYSCLRLNYVKIAWEFRQDPLVVPIISYDK